MSCTLINRSPDLAALRREGYEIDIRANHLVLANVPYVNTGRQVKRGLLVSTLELAGDVTRRPQDHVVMFAGELPCDQQGQPLSRIILQSQRETLAAGLVVDHRFSSKPARGYESYHAKMATYAAMLSGPAEAIDPSATARTFQVLDANDAASPFEYLDTASSRAGIGAATERLSGERIGIVGLGGTGSYILDLVAKTPVASIHLFDGDWFGQHNAFRSPGATTAAELRAIPKKVHHYRDRYSAMRRHIVAHDVHLDASNLALLEGLNFVFLCIDDGSRKQPIIEKLEAHSVAFIDVGMGLQLVDGQLQGVATVTASSPSMRAHVRRRVSFGAAADDVYARNIQIVELNALNAALAVIRWKKMRGVYRDAGTEHFCAYTIDGNFLINEETACGGQ